MALSAVWACLNLNVGVISALPLHVYKTKDDGSRERVKDHPLSRLLAQSPNADQTAMEFWGQMQLSIETRGNAFSERDMISGRTVALTPIHPDCMTVSRNKGGKIVYEWYADGLRRTGTSETILHLHGFGGDALGGLSTLEFASRTFGLSRSISEAAKGAFENGMRPSGVLSIPGVLPPEKRDAIESGLISKFTGAMNAGRPMVLEGGLTWQGLSIKPEEAQMIEAQGFSIEEVCRFFGVPPFMIGHTEKTTSWGTGLSEQVLGYQKFTVAPRVERIEQRLMKQLLTPEERANGYVIEFSFEGLLRADTTSRYASYEVGLRNGFLVIDEVRRLENLPKVKGGDVPRMQSQNIPITDAGHIEKETA